MTQEEKAKAYDEALALAKRLISNNCTEVEKLCLKCVFPELKESEDERIRKWVISHFRECFNACVDNVEYQEFLNNKVIPWLEKQKEQKPAARENDFVSRPQTSVEILRHYLVWAGNSESEEDCPYTWRALADAIRDGIKALEEQKPAEWSDEDEQRIAEIEFAVMQMNTKRVDTKDKCLAWLKSLRPQQKVEWSEEDEENISTLIEVVYERMGLSEKRKQYYEKWLKSLRPKFQFGNLEYERGVKDGIQMEKKCRWKPSEEQMDALNEIINTLAASKHPHESDYLFNILNGLRKNLKKL